MPLKILRRQIFEKTAPLKFPWGRDVSRTFYVLISPKMCYLKDWFQRWFPIMDDKLRGIYPWIILDAKSKADTSQIITQVWDEAFSAETLNSLIGKGFRLVDTANQIILIGELTEENVVEKLKSIYNSFESRKLGSSQTSPYWVGLFLLRKKEEGEIKTPLDFDEFLSWAQEHLHRLFLVDISNGYSEISRQEDLHFLLGQLLYILTRKPMELENEFGGWLRRDSPEEGRCTGFSAISVLTPIDQLLEIALITKGAEVLEEAFFGDFPEERVGGYLNSLLNRTGLSSYETISSLLRRNPKYPLIDPLPGGGEPIWDLEHPEGFTSYLEDLDAKLPGYAEENERSMKEIERILLEDFRYELLDHLNAAISRERGGVGIAERFLEKLKKRMEDISKKIPDESSRPVYPDPLPLIRKLEDKIQKGPRRESVAVRTILLGITALLGALSSRALFDIPSLLFPLFFLLGIGGGLLYWYAWRNRTESLVIKIQRAIREKWDVLMKERCDRVMRGLIPNCISLIEEIESRVKATSCRLKELIDYSKSKHEAPAPMCSAFWMYAIKSSDEMREYSDMIGADISSMATRYLLNERPLELWERTSPSGSEEFNPWEWSLVEKAALMLIPYIGGILDLSVCRILRDSPERAENFAELFRRNSSPFIVLKAGGFGGEVRGTLEISEGGCEDIREMLENSVRGCFSSLSTTDSPTAYRISLFSFMEGIELNSLEVGGGQTCCS